MLRAGRGSNGCRREPGPPHRHGLARCIPKSRRDPRTHPDARRSRSSTRTSALALFAQLPEGLLAVDRFHPAALEIVVAAVERLADRGDLFEIPGKGVFDDVLGSTSAGLGEIFQLLGRFG